MSDFGLSSLLLFQVTPGRRSQGVISAQIKDKVVYGNPHSDKWETVVMIRRRFSLIEQC